jgi:hypothetical protein
VGPNVLGTNDIRLAEETIRDLRGGGQEERAEAIEALLAAATRAPDGRGARLLDDYATIRQAARESGLSARQIRQWIAVGRLPAVIQGGQTMVSREALWACIDALQHAYPPEHGATRHEAAAQRRQHELLVAGLPGDKVARQGALLEQMEEGQRLSRAEQAELVTLERELTTAAAQQLRHWIARSGPPES